MLHITDLHASVAGHKVLDGLDLHIGEGEVHALMGPNGAGKSTLSAVLTGRDDYQVDRGSITFDGRSLVDMTPEDRAVAGIFLAFQHPTEIPGVGNMYFLRTAVNAVREAKGSPILDAREFLSAARAHMAELGMDPGLLSRSVNTGFSGGEKKRNEMLQLAMLQPRLAILDETDSGLDIDGLQALAEGITRFRDPSRSLLIITHYPRLLEMVEPDHVHVIRDGRIARSGGLELADELSRDGYGPTPDTAGSAP